MASILNRNIGTEKNIAIGNGAILGWDRAAKKLFPTLTRKDDSVAWGFSVICGQDILESAGRWSGVATRRNERGLWMKVGFYPICYKHEYFVLLKFYIKSEFATYYIN